jgi:hypothetical protein
MESSSARTGRWLPSRRTVRRLSWIICLSGMLFGIVVGGSSWLLVIGGAIGVAAAKERSAVGRLSCAETAVTTEAPPTMRCPACHGQVMSHWRACPACRYQAGQSLPSSPAKMVRSSGSSIFATLSIIALLGQRPVGRARLQETERAMRCRPSPRCQPLPIQKASARLLPAGPNGGGRERIAAKIGLNCFGFCFALLWRMP